MGKSNKVNGEIRLKILLNLLIFLIPIIIIIIIEYNFDFKSKILDYIVTSTMREIQDMPNFSIDYTLSESGSNESIDKMTADNSETFKSLANLYFYLITAFLYLVYLYVYYKYVLKRYQHLIELRKQKFVLNMFIVFSGLSIIEEYGGKHIKSLGYSDVGVGLGCSLHICVNKAIYKVDTLLIGMLLALTVVMLNYFVGRNKE